LSKASSAAASLELGLIGNCQVASLIDAQATHVWTCLPRLDGDPVFCALLAGSSAAARQGGWAVALFDQVSCSQTYERNTAILETTLTDAEGAVLSPAQDYGARARRMIGGSHHIRFVGLDFDLRVTTNASIAAITTSIPESANSGRNWDYRFCWVRDSYFTIQALNRLGATRTMEGYIRFIQNLTATPPLRLQPCYAIDGGVSLDEIVIRHLPGYRDMGPVRVGNAAYVQVQLDVYGAAILAVTQSFSMSVWCGRAPRPCLRVWSRWASRPSRRSGTQMPASGSIAATPRCTPFPRP